MRKTTLNKFRFRFFKVTSAPPIYFKIKVYLQALKISYLSYVYNCGQGFSPWNPQYLKALIICGVGSVHAGQITETCRVTDNKILPQVDHLNNNAVVYRVCFHGGIKKRSKECWMKKYGEELGWFPPQFENS